MDKVACFYYPTTVVFIDDNEHHLTQIVFELDVNLNHITLSDPQKALHYLKLQEQHNILINIDPTLQNLQTPHRFNIPSVLAIDYDLLGTGMTGFTLSQEAKKLCAALKIQQPKIILVTGQASESTAIEGFHKGYIDRYLSKHNPDYGRKLNETILELQRIFLAERSASLFDQLAAQAAFCLKNPAFLAVLTQICQDHQIVEWHIVNRSGDFLLLKKDGTALWLVDGKLVTEPDVVPLQRETICSFGHYLDHFWPPI